MPTDDLPPPPPTRRTGKQKRSADLPPPGPEPEPEVLAFPDPPPPAAGPDDGPLDPMDDSGLTHLEREQLREVLAEFASRKMESLFLFEPLPEQERFLQSDADERIALGGNRGGKTTATCVEIARAVTGQDPYDKYPKADGRVILVGKDLTHCSKVFYRKLFKPGPFQMIKDPPSGRWRVFRPDDPGDRDRADEARPAPPLIPPRFDDSRRIAWEEERAATARAPRETLDQAGG